jgi:transposase InsO family protein
MYLGVPPGTSSPTSPIVTLLVRRALLAAENLALRQQLSLLQRSAPRPRFRLRDRLLWVALCRCFDAWRSWLAVAQPATALRWHRQGFGRFWKWRSRGRLPGRPSLDREVRALVRRMARENPTWGAPRIAAELRLLGHDVATSTVSKYLPAGRRPPSQTWKMFLRNHAGSLASVDFCAVPTVTFRLLYVFAILCHERRRVVHVNVTAHPTAAFVAQQLREAFPFEATPKYLIRDRDSIYGDEVRRCLNSLGITEVVIAPRSPWQNPYVERFFGTLRRECLNHVLVLNEGHLRRTLREYLAYYHQARTHMALADNAPEPRTVEPPSRGRVRAIPYLGGLHHRYARCA